MHPAKIFMPVFPDGVYEKNIRQNFEFELLLEG
jgi:hypothetical protein